MIQKCTLNENQVTANWTKNATIYVNAAQQRIFVLRIEKLQTQPVRAVSGRLWSWVVLLLPSHVTVLRHTPPLPSKAGITVPAYCYTRTSGHSWTWGLYCISQQTQPSHSSLKELNVARVTSLSLSLSTDCADTAVLWPGQASRYTSVTLCLCQVLHNTSQISSSSALPFKIIQAPDVAPVIKGHCLSFFKVHTLSCSPAWT